LALDAYCFSFVSVLLLSAARWLRAMFLGCDRLIGNAVQPKLDAEYLGVTVVPAIAFPADLRPSK
jgi:hypothetical protein